MWRQEMSYEREACVLVVSVATNLHLKDAMGKCFNRPYCNWAFIC